MPQLYIIAGPNGAGKTTASFNILPKLLDCKEFVNADEIARGLSPFNAEAVAFEAGRIMLERIMELKEKGEDFAFETTLSTISYKNLIKKAQMEGYVVTLFFFYLASEELAIKRVKKRVANGGHNIPEDIIRRRYQRGLANLMSVFMPIVDNWILYDNSEEASLIAEGSLEGESQIYDEKIWVNLINLYNEK